jgi:hypothetical protein
VKQIQPNVLVIKENLKEVSVSDKGLIKAGGINSPNVFLISHRFLFCLFEADQNTNPHYTLINMPLFVRTDTSLLYMQLFISSQVSHVNLAHCTKDKRVPGVYTNTIQ